MFIPKATGNTTQSHRDSSFSLVALMFSSKRLKMNCDATVKYSVFIMSSSENDMVIAFMYFKHKKAKKKNMRSSVGTLHFMFITVHS